VTDGLQHWVEQLSAAPLPVWAQSRQALLELAGGGRYNSAALTRALAHDPLLCAQLLRAANAGRGGGSIATLEQAAVMLGARALHRLAEQLPVLEERLPAPALEPLEQHRRFNFYVGYLARELIRRLRNKQYDDAFFAGLLHNLGELALRAQAQPVVTSGVELPALSAALAEHWRLPPLLRAVLDERQRQDKASELVRLSARFFQLEPANLLIDSQAPWLERAANLLNESSAALRPFAFTAATGASAWLYERLSAATPEVAWLYPPAPPSAGLNLQRLQ
jgi:hypothetical protein